MNQILEFFRGIFNTSDWPPRWQCGKWSEFHGWLYIISDLLIWSAYFAIPLLIIRYISRKQGAKFIRLYFLFAAFILACGTTHFLDAMAFWWPAYRLNGLFRLITAVVSWATIFSLIRYLPLAFSLKTNDELQFEIVQRQNVEEELRQLNGTLEQRVAERTAELEASLRELSTYKFALDQSSIVAITNSKGTITHVNEKFCAISKYEAHELVGSDHRIINSGYHSKKYIQELWQTITLGEIWKGELKNRAKDGSHYWVDTTIVPFKEENGRPYQYVAIRAEITKLKNTEENLSLSLKEVAAYKYALDAAAVVAVTNANGIITQVNDNFCLLSGYTRQEISGGVHPLITPEYHSQQFAKSVWNTLSPGKIWKGELKHKSKDGTCYWVDTTIVPFINSGSAPFEYLAIQSDVTERKRSEQKIIDLNSSLTKSEQQFRAMIENSKDVFIVSDAGGVSFVSRGITELLGYSEKEFAALTPVEIVHPDDQPLRWNELSKPGNVITLEYRGLHKNGEWRWLEGTGINLQHVEGIKGIVFTIRDTTDKKHSARLLEQSEKIYKTIASGIPGSYICLLDPEHRYLLAEGDLYNKLGHNTAFMLGRIMEDIFPAKENHEFFMNINRAFNGELFDTETELTGFDLLNRFIPLRDENQEVYAVMVVGIDVSDLKKAQRQIAELNSDLESKVIERTEQLRIVNDELEAFSYSVSHDLRTPLRAVSGYARMLEEDYSKLLDDEGKRLLNVIQQSARNMGELIDNLLEFSRLGRKDVQRSMVDFNEMVRGIIKDISLAHGYQAEVDLPNLHPAYADSTLIRQVFVNLISNAFKYSAKKANPAISISSTRENNHVVYSVSDNGSGFDMKYQQKLFTVFERLHNNEEFEGTGVGLAISKKIVDKHKGTIWAHGKVAQGATFYFSLPLPNSPANIL